MANDIELQVTAGDGPGRYEVRVLRAASGGEPRESLDLDVPRILGLRPTLENAVLASAARARSGRVPEMERPLRDAGQELFEGLFNGSVRETYRASVAVARERGAKLRVVLHLDAPELAALPWEAMWDPEAQAYLCRKEPLVRHVPAPYTPDPLPVQPPMRILCLVASPRGLPELDVAVERQRLDQALSTATADGRIHVEWLVDATWDALQDRLMTGTWHVLHFIGHGDYEPGLDQGRVALVREEDGRADWVEAGRLVDLLNEADPTPRLVVLNSCSTGQSGTQDVLSGTAAALVNGGVSAVAAMQFRISDPAAVAFPRGFYKALAAGKSVEAALSSGRIAILGRGESLEWVTPVLYMRGGTSQLFTVQPAVPQNPETPTHPTQTQDRTWSAGPASVPNSTPAPASPTTATVPTLPTAVVGDPRYQRAQTAYRHGHLDEAITLFEQIHTEHPTADIPELAKARSKLDLASRWAANGNTVPIDATRPPLSPTGATVSDRHPAHATSTTPKTFTPETYQAPGGITPPPPPLPLPRTSAEPGHVAPRPAPDGHRRRSVAIASTVLLLVLAIGGAWLLTSGGTDVHTMVQVPDLQGMTREQAEEELEALHLAVGSVQSEPSDEFNDGRIIRTSPATGREVPLRSAVVLFVSTGPSPKPVQVPDLEGMTREQAVEELEALRLAVGSVQSEPSDQFEEGRVIRSQPPDGTRTSTDDPVDLIVSSGPAPLPTLETPVLLSPDDGATFSEYPRTTTLEWQAVPGAQEYLVEVQFLGGPDFSDYVSETVTEPRFTFDFVGAQPGRWRVTALADTMKASTPSEWRAFEYTV